MCLLPENDYQILKLTEAFYKQYPNPPYIEILKKKNRAYNCLIFQTHYEYLICIPYRSEISHKYAYLFRNSQRSITHRSGLDYTKIVILQKTEYLDTVDALVDKDEFNETMVNLERIKREALTFVEDYVSYAKGYCNISPEEFKRRYSYSPLQYFHKELGI